MRFMIICEIPTEAGNKMVEDENFPKGLEEFIEKNNAEAYFTVINGERTAIFVLDIPSVDTIPVIAEPLLRLGFNTEAYPVMNIEELKSGITKVKEMMK